MLVCIYYTIACLFTTDDYQVLHPAARLAYFEDPDRWDPSIAIRARVLLEHLFEVYSEECMMPVPAQKDQVSKSIFGKAIKPLLSSKNSAQPAGGVMSEVAKYLTGIYPTQEDDPLPWFKVRLSLMRSCRTAIYNGLCLQLHAHEFPIISLIARDVLAIPGVSISVERLFSSSKHTLSDSRSSLTAESSSKAVVSKEWLKAGLGENLNYLDGRTIH